MKVRMGPQVEALGSRGFWHVSRTPPLPGRFKGIRAMVAADEAGPDGDPVLSRVQGGPRAPHHRGEGRGDGGRAALRRVPARLRDQGRDPEPPPAGLQMNSACAARIPAGSAARAYASKGSRFRTR